MSETLKCMRTDCRNAALSCAHTCPYRTPNVKNSPDYYQTVKNDGPTLLITAGIHGGEYPGIAAAMELGHDIEPDHVTGCLIMMHPVNIQGFGHAAK